MTCHERAEVNKTRTFRMGAKYAAQNTLYTCSWSLHISVWLTALLSFL